VGEFVVTDPPNNHAGRSPKELEVLIAGAGVAGLEAAFALRDLAGDHVCLSIIAPTDEFVYRPMSVAEPFAAGRAQHYRLAALADAANATLLHDALVRVDVPQRRALTSAGAELTYDALLICLGATVHTRYKHATTVDDAHLDDLLHGLVQDIEGGSIQRLAFVVPSPMPWPLPVYELALMAAERAWERQTDLAITVLTPEKAPLAIFGPEVSRDLTSLLTERKIEIVTSAQCEVPDAKTVLSYPGDRRLEVDRVVALPELRGPSIPGLPFDNSGFVPIDNHTAVMNVEHVWAAGDATDFPIKHGGVSAQMVSCAQVRADTRRCAPNRKEPASIARPLLWGATCRDRHARARRLASEDRGEVPRPASRLSDPHDVRSRSADGGSGDVTRDRWTTRRIQGISRRQR
jgi:sulfide:quinone oxidoreductase